MTMKQYLTKLVGEQQKFLELSKNEFDKLVSVRSKLFQALFIEEKLDLIIENYLEYEMELLSSSANHMLFGNQDWEWFTKDVNRVSRRIINLLTSARLYVDQIVHHLSTIYGRDHEIISIISSVRLTIE